MSRNNRLGLTRLKILLLVVVIAVVGLVGWKFYEKQQQPANNPGTTQVEAEQSEPPEVNSANDLKEAEDFVKDTDIDGQLDTTEIDAALSEQLR